jgi:hypothetical protein
MTWLHYTSTEITKIQTQFDQHRTLHKPDGLWCSYNDEWLKWCTHNCYYPFDPNNHYLYKVKLNKTANILIIDSFDKYMSFKCYKDPNVSKYFTQNISNWRMIKNDYDGIAFLNYDQINIDMYESGIKDKLILALDVNSCCIWNPVYELVLLKTINNK